MELKTKDGKYFSQLGSWMDLVKVIFLVIVFKIFGIIGVFFAGILVYFVIPKLFFKKDSNDEKGA